MFIICDDIPAFPPYSELVIEARSYSQDLKPENILFVDVSEPSEYLGGPPRATGDPLLKQLCKYQSSR